METTLEKISRKTGRKLIECKCQLCKQQCKVSCCIGTPQDILKLINAGFRDRLSFTDWAAGIMMGVTKDVVPMVQADYDSDKGSCTFFNNGLCELHDAGLKPTEGKLSHHSTRLDNFDPKKSLGWHVAKEWLEPANYETIAEIIVKMNI